jgi:hypothetical protein
MILKESNLDLPSDSIYRTKVDLDTLEAISRLKPLSSTKNAEKIIRHKSSSRAGLPYNTNTVQEMNKIMHHEFQRDYLNDKLTRNAFEFHKALTSQPRGQNTKSSLLRKNKNALNIIQKNIDRQIEDLKSTKAN